MLTRNEDGTYELTDLPDADGPQPLPLTEANLRALAGTDEGPDPSIYPAVADHDSIDYPPTQQQAVILAQHPHDSLAPRGSQANEDTAADNVVDQGPTVQSQEEDGADRASSTQSQIPEPPGYELDWSPEWERLGFCSRGTLARDVVSSEDTIETEVVHYSQEEYERLCRRSDWCHPIDERIWQKLPRDIVCHVIEQSDRDTQISWSCTSRLYYIVASNSLWKEVIMRPAELVGYKRTRRLERRMQVDNLKRDSDLLINFLAEEAFRHPLKGFWINFASAAAKSPGERIKCLDINFRGPLCLPDLTKSSKIRQTTSVLLSLVPSLRALAFDGMLDPQTFGSILHCSRLRALKIRGSADVLTSLAPNPPWNQILDLSCLGSLTNLRKLTIGRLVPREAQGLAKALVDLELSLLFISAAPPAAFEDLDFINNFRGDNDDESPLLTFLKSLRAVQQGQRFGSYSLPQSLQVLRLRDHYRGWEREHILGHENVLYEAVSGCRNLTHLEIRVKACTPLEIFLQRSDLPCLHTVSMEACEHSLDWTDWIKVGLDAEKMLVSRTPPSRVAYALRDFLHKHRSTLHLLSLTHTSWGPEDQFGHNFALDFDQSHLSGLWDAGRGGPPMLNSCARQNWERGAWSDGCSPKGHCYCYGEGDVSTADHWTGWR
ncbi:MAG: hypothetical protein LQ346_004331 [Caloplaca aetnensis]|nr:MAG: hypothetical protein LQ346_004331 [Caloplaca aetnensis]